MNVDKCSEMKFLVIGCLPLLEYIYIYIDHTKFAAYMAYSSIIFFHILLVPFLFVCARACLHVLYASAQFCKLCIFIVMFIYSYC
jgi:hypothetical protein